ncbi:Homeobox leucine zipper protein [Quillaja saponaria]|uniref:Homeobox leucine zipper protein n=1 Tax=Quillaja saponaria TaxID=32244 RepID=A0AAD7M4U6_QUISA|nr:Homeobox leucine zipper protein [Quillaja saponaria]
MMGFEGLISSGIGNRDGGGARVVADNSAHNQYMPNGAFAEPPLFVSPNITQNSSALPSSTLRKMEDHNEMGRIGENFDQNMAGRLRAEDDESRSGSENLSGEDQEAGVEQRGRKRKYHRHTPYQIQELEAFFKEIPHPDDKQRLELSRRLGLESKQVKFWFQNRRTQMKSQLERHENIILRQDNEKLRTENCMMKEAMANPICNNCGGPAVPGNVCFEEHQLRIENARLKEELKRICTLANRFLGRPLSSMVCHPIHSSSNTGLELAVGRNGFGSLSTAPAAMPLGLDVGDGGLATMPALPMGLMENELKIDRSVLVEIALAAMDELIKIARADTPLWFKRSDGEEILNHEEYARTFPPCIGTKPIGFVSEATKSTGIVIINSLALVETLMDANRWSEMFPSLVARAETLDTISGGMGGSRNGSLQVMNAEIQVLSPLVPVRSLRFLRFCKQHAEGVWVVVDVSIEVSREGTNAHPSLLCRKLPSGCVVLDMPNGYSKVTWIEHTEYDESVIDPLYRPLLSSGIGFGANRWIATLQRQCECLAILMATSIHNDDNSVPISPAGKRSMLKLAQRLTNNFCAGVCASTARKWDKLHLGSLGDDVKVMSRTNVDDPGEPPGIVLSAATSVWMPVSRQRLFSLLKDERLRSEWDILSNGGPMQEVVHIAKGQGQGNCVSLLRPTAIHPNENSMLILQETWTDASCSLVVYAPVDVASLDVVMNGGDSSYVALLPSGFAILPDVNTGKGGDDGNEGGGCLLTVAFQILVNSIPTAKLTVESVETVNNLITCTVEKIKSAAVRVA